MTKLENGWTKRIEELERREKVLRDALVKAEQDINWMINSEKLLQRFVFNYVDEALAQTDSK